ncbi:MAG: hypothetical protein D6730_15015 [Bacteroidetes bacterium]|nr:MAG: hypothetical protein D6730_15015 [Bacteroidota bacterium]
MPFSRYCRSGHLLLWGLLLVACLPAARAQSRLMPHLGVSYEVVVQETRLVPSTSQGYYFTNLHAGIYYALYQLNDRFSFGIDPSIHLGGNFTTADPNAVEVVFDYNLQTPVFLLARVMRASTPYNRQPAGIGLGIGAVATAYKRTITLSSFQKAEFAHLAAVLEGNFSTGRGHISIRLRAPLGKVISTVRFSGPTPDTRFYFSSWGLSVAYGFDRK